VTEVLQSFSELGAPSGAAAAEQPLGAFERLGEQLTSLGGRDRRCLRVGGDGGALREDAVEVGSPDADATADPVAARATFPI
jgi:hypothetical protein